mgnify:CR=1 FL=1|tara:strand:+ start:240 stop:443 length:204 start_codon:yes stop_codon:yes gene_type:complete
MKFNKTIRITVFILILFIISTIYILNIYKNKSKENFMEEPLHAIGFGGLSDDLNKHWGNFQKIFNSN